MKKQTKKKSKESSIYICIFCEEYVLKPQTQTTQIQDLVFKSKVCPVCGNLVHNLYNIPFEVAKRMWPKSDLKTQKILVYIFGKNKLQVKKPIEGLEHWKYNYPREDYAEHKLKLLRRKENK